MRRSGKEEERKMWTKKKEEEEKDSMCPEMELLLCLLSSPADGCHGQDEEHHRTGTIQSLQRQGEDSYSVHWREGRSYSAHWREGRSTTTTSLFLNTMFGSPV